MASRTKPYRCGYACDCLIDPKAPPELDTCSYGGGHQSTALLVLAAREQIPTRTFLFCNVGDDSEHPGTLEYVRTVAAPYAAFHGIDLQELHRTRRDGTSETLMGRLLNPITCRTCDGTGTVGEFECTCAADDIGHWPLCDAACADCGGTGERQSRSLPIPIRMSNGAPNSRSCTSDFKIRVVGRWLKAHGARPPKRCAPHKAEDDALTYTAHLDDGTTEERTGLDRGVRPDCPACDPGHIAQVSIGISQDEAHRANTRTVDPWERPVYPLISKGIDTGLQLRRDDCDTIIRTEPLPPSVALQIKQAVADGHLTTPSVVTQLERSGYTTLPIPPKSSCFFCPFHKPAAWADLARETPELFDRAAELEDTLNARRTMLGKDPVYLTRFAIPLRQAIDTDQPMIPGFDDLDGQCDSGYCFT